MLVRKSRTITIRFEARPALDLGQILSGSLSVVPHDRPVAVSTLTRKSRVLSDKELRLLCEMNSWDWIPSEDVTRQFDISAETLEEFLTIGLLVGDAEEPSIQALRQREERLDAMEWDEYAFYYHMMNRTKDENPFRVGAAPVALNAPENPGGPGVAPDHLGMMTQLAHHLMATAYHHGPAPTHFYEVADAADRRELQLPENDGPLFDLLRNRKTVRLFDPQNPMTEKELSTVLYYTFGCQGIAPLTEGVVALKKTSPSGGALHPIEAFPLVLNIDGWPSGLYHYNVQNHRMDLLRSFAREDGARLAEEFTAGQSYFATAHVLFILIARFYRNFWKYRRAPRSFRVIQLDAGHLGQTMSLVCTALGLGSFFTAAINDINIEEALGIDPVEQGAIGILGCGRPITSYALTLESHPFIPRGPAT